MNTDTPSINTAAPQAIDHVIGQRQAVELLKVALAAYWTDNAAGRHPDFGHVLMTGGPGLGKTLLAQIIAKELAGPFKECLGQTFGLGEDVFQTLLGMPDDSVLFIDEAHLCVPEVQTILFRAVEEGKVFVPKGPLSNRHTAVPLARFTLILATTDEHRLLQPLRDRMKLTLRFDYYTPDELAELCRQRSKALKWEIEGADVFHRIARRAKGTPRLAIRLLEGSYRTARSQGDEVITPAHVERTCMLEGLDGKGLDLTERKYLNLLAQSRGKPVRLNVISSVLGLPNRTISEVTEKFLLRAGLIVRCENGRVLTEQGVEYVGNNPQSESPNALPNRL